MRCIYPVGYRSWRWAERLRTSAQINVDDQGPGIAPEDRKRVFERFERLSRDRNSPVTGAGIGLAVVGELVDRMGGRCFVESREPPDVGARFVVELPVATEGSS
jgi:signal transduction histidine kinase